MHQNNKVILEKVDSVFAKLFYSNSPDLVLHKESDLNPLSCNQTTHTINYSHDEAIKQQNQSTNIQNPTTNKKLANNFAKEIPHTDNYTATNINNPLKILESLGLNSSYVADTTKASHRNFIITDIECNHASSKTIQQENMELILVNPYKLRDYSFTIPEYITMILHITTKSKILVYCPLDLNNPLESSEINYLFPIIFNTQTKLAAQIPLSIMDYPEFTKQTLRLYL